MKKKSLTIALVGNPNSGKTTLFNELTGTNQYVGNWPGVTVEKKTGRLKKHGDISIVDLPGIYSLSPYTQEEVIARNYLVEARPDLIINIVDGTSLERNLYLTTQLADFGIPMVIAVNMMDTVERNKDLIDLAKLAARLGIKLVAVSALKRTGLAELVDTAIAVSKQEVKRSPYVFSGTVEHALAHIEEAVLHDLPDDQQRWYAIKLFERDAAAISLLNVSEKALHHIEADIRRVEKTLDDDSESVIANERYERITTLLKDSYRRKNEGKISTSDKIDRIVTNRWLALPVFAFVMFLVYFLSVSTIGAWATDWANDGLFGDGFHLFGRGSAAYEEAVSAYERPAATIQAFESAADGANLVAEKATALTVRANMYDEYGKVSETILVDHAAYEAARREEQPDPHAYGTWVRGIPVVLDDWLTSVGTAPWLQQLIVNGIVAGVGAVLGFVPQMLVLFLLLAILEGCGYMARIAFVLDRIFRKFGLSGKSFIPMLIGTGCSVPGIMASRTIENESDKRMTIMVTSFMPCSAKLPVIALIAGAMFGGSVWVAPSAYFIGILAIIVSGIMLKKTARFTGDPAPFVMELPTYRWPTPTNVLRSMWQRGYAFIKKAGTIILLASVLIWFLSSFGIEDGAIRFVDMNDSILAAIGGGLAWIFRPLGWGHWQGAVATVSGLIAKENIVGTFGVLFGGMDNVAENGWQIWTTMRQVFTPLAAYSFLIFNLLCTPCFAAIGAIRREMNSAGWTWFAICYQTVFAYAVALAVYQLGSWFNGDGNLAGIVAGLIVMAVMTWMLIRPNNRKLKTNAMGVRPESRRS